MRCSARHDTIVGRTFICSGGLYWLKVQRDSFRQITKKSCKCRMSVLFEYEANIKKIVFDMFCSALGDDLQPFFGSKPFPLYLVFGT